MNEFIDRVIEEEDGYLISCRECNCCWVEGDIWNICPRCFSGSTSVMVQLEIGRNPLVIWEESEL